MQTAFLKATKKLYIMVKNRIRRTIHGRKRRGSHPYKYPFSQALHDENAPTETIAFGTRGFAPPEQYGFAQPDARSDLFSLGVLILNIKGLPVRDLSVLLRLPELQTVVIDPNLEEKAKALGDCPFEFIVR